MKTNILSVGIDIGTSTTQVIFSRLLLENTSGYFSVPHVAIVDKQVVYQGAIHTTPLASASLIDGEAVSRIVAEEFRQAGFSPEDTQTGAVIITGESSRKENAAIVLEKLSHFAGDFVVSTAGPDMEAIIAGKGSGAHRYSLQNNCRVANLDIGGGTTNIAVFDYGDVCAKGCLDIGGRLLKLAEDLTVLYISPTVEKIAQWQHIAFEVGKQTTLQALETLCDGMNQILEQLFGLAEPTPLLAQLQTNGSSPFAAEPIDCICFSGGVADFIYRSDTPSPFCYGDIGILLGQAIRSGRLCSSFRLIKPSETIRATVIGAGSYTTNVSGSTITYDQNLLPLKNIPVLRLSTSEEQCCFLGQAPLLEERMRWFLQQSEGDLLILSLAGKANPSFQQIKTLGACIATAAHNALAPGQPVLVVTEHDMAKALGQFIDLTLKGQRSVICIDQICASQHDYLDLGPPLLNGLAIPVVVKTLLLG